MMDIILVIMIYIVRGCYELYFDLQYNPKAEPQSYWKNTSDNAIIRSFIDYSGSNITRKLEVLMSGDIFFSI